MPLEPKSETRVVVIGGGTGTFMLLSALRNHTENLSAIVAMSDDGGSTGVLRDELGALPPGDVRQCLVALSNSPEYMRELFNYRFEEGGMKGHAFGNLLLTALEKVSGGFAEGVKRAEAILNVKGRVIPVTTEDVRLRATMPDGQSIDLERNIQEVPFEGRRPLLTLDPHPQLNPEAAEAIAAADIVVVGPGDLYSSLIPVLLPEGMSETLASASAVKVYVANLVNKPSKTDGMKVHDYVDELERHLGRRDIFDAVIYNTAAPSDEVAKRYLREGEQPVEYDKHMHAEHSYQAIGADLIAGGVDQKGSDTLLKRNLIRHDGEKLTQVIMDTLKK